MLNDKLVTKNNLNKNNKELYKKLKDYIDNTKSTSITDEEFDNMTDELLKIDGIPNE